MAMMDAINDEWGAFSRLLRYPATPREYWAVDLFEWPARPRSGAEEVEKICGRIRKAIAAGAAL